MPTRKNSRAANGMGTIRQRKDTGRWEGRYTTGRDPGTGVQIQKSVYGATQKEVVNKLAAIRNGINDGTYTEPSKLTVGAWLNIWLKDYVENVVKPATFTSYKGRVENRIKPAIGALKLSEIKPPSIQAFYNALSQSEKGKNVLSPKSILNIHGILHKAFEQAIEIGYLKVNPCNACKLPRVEKPDVNPLDDEQMSAFLTAIQGHKYETMYIIDLFTGLRQGELLGLGWDAVNFEAGTIYIYRQLQFLDGTYTFRSLKNDKTRTLTPAAFVMDILRRQQRTQAEWRLRAGRAWEDSGLVFTNELGHHLSRSTTYHNYKAIVASIGISDRRLHDLRHSYGVASLRAGDDIKTLQANMGHHSAAFTLDVYGHVTEQMKRDSSARMDAYIKGIKTS